MANGNGQGSLTLRIRAAWRGVQGGVVEAARGLSAEDPGKSPLRKEANEALRTVDSGLEVAAHQLLHAGKVVRAQTKSRGEEGVLAEEVIDIAHRVRDLESRGESQPDAGPPGDQGSSRAGESRGGRPAEPTQDRLSIDQLIDHLQEAATQLESAATLLRAVRQAPGEEGVLVEEVIDVAHRVTDRRDRRIRERTTQTGEFFDTGQEDPESGGPLGFLFGN